MSWPGATSPGMPRRQTATWPSGRGSGCAMPGSAWPGAVRWSEPTAWPSCQPARGAPPPGMSREAAPGELARRYLAGHAPAADLDLAQWAGIGLADARLGLARCGAIQREEGLAELPANRLRAVRLLPPPLLLGAFDPLLLGWASRDPIVGPHRQIVTVNGLFRPFALAGGRAVATWSTAGGKVTLAPFAPLDTRTQAALAADAVDVMRFLGRGS